MPQEIATILVQILPLVLIFVVFYFLLIRPQRKKDKEVKNMLANLKVGDRITTIGGFYATIAAIKDDVITISFGPESTKAMIARWPCAPWRTRPPTRRTTSSNPDAQQNRNQRTSSRI